MKRSDLICENSVINDKTKQNFVHNYRLAGTKCSEVTVDEKYEKILNKACGRYFTLYGRDCGEALFLLLKKLLPEKGSAMVVGLGNEKITADSLGVKCLRYIPATAHLSVHSDFSELGLRKVYVIETGVTGQTGIETARQARLIADEVGADFIVAVDSLACSEAERLCRTVQVTDTGISPGAGVGNDRKALNRETAGRKVFAVGVPTVIDYDADGETFMVTPRNIDRVTDDYSKMIGIAVSRALNPSLSYEELSALIV